MTGRSTRDRGSVATEMVLLTPVLVVLVLFVVHAGRAGIVADQVRHAADQGARAASLVSPGAMSAEARSAVTADLQSNGVACVSPSVTVDRHPSVPATVTVSVTCSIDVEGLSLLGVRSRSLTARSTEVVDRFRSET